MVDANDAFGILLGMARRSKSPFEKDSSPLQVRVVEALLKLSLGLRKFSWDRAAAVRLTPTQGEVLRALNRAGHGVRMREIAAAVAVSAPTATEAVQTLENKGLVSRESEEDDRRVVRVVATDAGRALSVQLDEWFDSVARAVASLPEQDSGDLLRILLNLLHRLQRTEGMPTLKMCITCQYFRPFSSTDPQYPHVCELVGAPFADRHLRVDCPEQVPAANDQATERWINLRRKNA